MSEQMISYNIISGSQIRTIDILDGGANLKVTDDMGNTLLHIAFRNEEPDQSKIIKVFDILLNRGLDINVKNSDGKTVLHLAISRCLKGVIDFCIQRNADLNFTDCSSSTLGHFVVEEECRKYHHLISRYRNIAELENESSSFVDWMVSQGIDFFHKRNKYNQSAFYLAIELNLQPILLILLKHVTDFHFIEKDQVPLLCYFLEMKSKAGRGVNSHDYKSLAPIHSTYYPDRHFYNIVKIILEKYQSMTNKTVNSALRIVIKNHEPLDIIDLILCHARSVRRINPRLHDHSLIRTFTDHYQKRIFTPWIEDGMKILKKLVDKGADVNEIHENEETIAMKWFRLHPKLKMLRLLQDCRADFSARTKDDESFLHIIGRYSNENGMVEIAREGCDVNSVNSKGQTPLHIAIVCGNSFVAINLLDFSAKFHDIFDDMSALILACLEGRAEVVEKMIHRGADLGYRNYFKKTLLHLALNSQKTVEVLLINGIDVNAQDKEGRTPLHLAEHVSVIKTLINAGALIDPPDNEGRTPLYYAIFKTDRDILVELLKAGADVRDGKVFQRAFDFFQHPSQIVHDSSKKIGLHLVKFRALGLLKEIIHAVKGKKEELHSYSNLYQAEVNLLEDYFVDDCTSLYQLLRRNRNRRCAYADNEKLKNLVEDDKIDQEFPNYFVIIIGCYNEARVRKPLLEKAPDILKEIVKVYLPDLCVDEILTYLSNMDLVRFIEACEIL